MAEIINKLLIIEDDEALVKMYSIKFKNAGFSIDYALNGEIALEKLQKHEYNLILLDLMLPKMDGFELLEKLRKSDYINKNKIVIALTNLSLDADRKKISELGANGFIVKANLTPSQIVNQIKGYLLDPSLSKKN